MPARVVTAIAAKDTQRVAVELDGDPWLVLDALTAARLGLAVGCELDAARVGEAERLATEERALQRGAALIGRRSHARTELEAKLARRDGAEAARAAAQRLQDVGAVDDTRHAAELAAQRLRSGWGPARIDYDLAQAGVDADLRATALAALDPGAVEAAARLAVGDRCGEAAWRRLAARGFDEDMAERLAGPLDSA